MLNYTDEQIYKIIKDIFKSEDFKIVSVGNHHLKRHLVYQVIFDNCNKYIFKLYYRDKRRSREVSSLKLLEHSEIKCPRVYKYGNLQDGSEWLITQYIDGVVFDKVFNDISYENKLSVFYEMGKELGKLHAFKTFKHFGELNEEGNFIYKTNSYYENFIKRIENSFECILTSEFPNKELLTKAIKYIKSNYSLIKIDFIPKLTHKDYDARNVLVINVNGIYELSGIIDFEGCYPSNDEDDLISLYFKYFFNDKKLERTFLDGYSLFNEINEGFEERLFFYLLSFAVENCSWAYYQAPDYFNENILFLKKAIAPEIDVTLL